MTNILIFKIENKLAFTKKKGKIPITAAGHMHLRSIENSNNSLHVPVTCRLCFIVLLLLFAPSFELVSLGV